MLRDLKELQVWKESRQLLIEIIELSEADKRKRTDPLKKSMRSGVTHFFANLTRTLSRPETVYSGHKFSHSNKTLNVLKTDLDRLRTSGKINDGQYRRLTDEIDGIRLLLSGLSRDSGFL